MEFNINAQVSVLNLRLIMVHKLKEINRAKERRARQAIAFSRKEASLGALCSLYLHGPTGMTDFLSGPFAPLRDISAWMIANY